MPPPVPSNGGARIANGNGNAPKPELPSSPPPLRDGPGAPRPTQPAAAPQPINPGPRGPDFSTLPPGIAASLARLAGMQGSPKSDEPSKKE